MSVTGMPAATYPTNATMPWRGGQLVSSVNVVAPPPRPGLTERAQRLCATIHTECLKAELVQRRLVQVNEIAADNDGEKKPGDADRPPDHLAWCIEELEQCMGRLQAAHESALAAL